jgi:hypothetical protein
VSDDLAACSTAELVALFKKLHVSAEKNWRLRVAVIGELAARLEGSGRQRCKVVASMLGISEPYCRQLYKVSQSFTGETLEAVMAPPSRVIVAAYSPDPVTWLKASEDGLTAVAMKRKIRAAKSGKPEAPDGPSELTVYARCRTCGNVGWQERLPAPELVVEAVG